jgi:oxygen-independent coproporphyrinogen-3 oxidase
VRLTADDRLRRDVITQVMCNPELRFDEFEAAYGLRFAETFAPELKRLRGFEKDGLVSISAGKLEVQMAGRMLVRNIAMVFDHYLGQQTPERFSRTV